MLDSSIVAPIDSSFACADSHATAAEAAGSDFSLEFLPDWVCATFVALLASFWFFRVLASHVADADAYLVHVCAIANFDGIDMSRVYGEMQTYYRAAHPGFFPLGPLPLAAWLIDWPAPLVKLPQYLLILITFATYAVLVRRLFGTVSSTVVATVICMCAFQFRSPHDPVIGTSLLTPWFAELILLSFTGWLSYRESNSRVWLGISYAAIVLAMLTDPIAWGFGLLLLAMSLRRAAARWTALPFIVIVSSTVIVELVLGPPEAPWRHAGGYVSNVSAELVAAVPTSYRALGHLPVGHVAALWHGDRFYDDRFSLIPPIAPAGWVAVAFCTFALFVALVYSRGAISAPQKHEAALLGFGFWIIPALGLGPSDIWQRGLPWGQAFDGVFLEYFGIAVLVTLALCRVRENLGAAKVVPATTVLVVFILSFGNMRADAVALERSQRMDDARSLVQRAASADFFSSIPEGSTIAIAANVPFANGLHSEIADARYALYHYSRKRFIVVPTDRVASATRDVAWLLQTSRTSGIYVSLARLARSEGRNFLADSAFGFTVGDDALLPANGADGIFETSTPLRDGRLIYARRLCGPVAAKAVFAASKPSLTWGPAFFPIGPAGYRSADAVSDSETASPTYGKMLMGSRGFLAIAPTNCRADYVDFRAAFVTAAAATLTIRSRGRIERLPVSPTPAFYKLRYAVRAHDSIRIDMSTNAPSGDLNPIPFRYERDRPRDVRLVVQPTDLSEGLRAPSASFHRKALSRWR